QMELIFRTIVPIPMGKPSEVQMLPGSRGSCKRGCSFRFATAEVQPKRIEIPGGNIAPAENGHLVQKQGERSNHEKDGYSVSKQHLVGGGSEARSHEQDQADEHKEECLPCIGGGLSDSVSL